MNICPGCKKRRFWFQKWACNTSWHKDCWISWEAGNNTRIRFESDMYGRINTITVDEIYELTNPYITVDIYNIRKRLVKSNHGFAENEPFIVAI